MKNKVAMKFGVDGLAAFCLLGLLAILYILQFGGDSSTPIISIGLASWIGLAEIALIVINWHRAYYRLLAPSFIVVVALYLVMCGQSIMWAFGLDAGYRDLIQSPQWGLTDAQIVKGLLYSELCILVLHLTVMFTLDGGTKKTKDKVKRHAFMNNHITAKASYSAILTVAAAVICIAIGPYLLDAMQTYSYYKALGYSGAYDNVSYGIDSLMAKIGAFYPVGVVMIIMCWGKRTTLNKEHYFWKALTCYSLVGIVIFVSLLLGRRTNLILYAFTFLIIWFKDKKMSRSAMLVLLLVGLAGMAGMRAIDLLRSGGIEGLADFFDFFAGTDDNPIIDFLGDIGWNLITTLELQSLVPFQRDFGHGFTYLVSLTSVVPNLGFWAIHPASEYGAIDNWLQSVMGLSYGIGFTPVAEAYYNFGVFGPLVFIVVGWFVSKMNLLFERQNQPLSFLLPVIFTGIIVKSFVRSCFSVVIRPMFLYMVLLPLVIYLIAKQIDQKKGN